MADPSFVRILLVDDHTIVREGLKKLINEDAHMAVVGEASNGRDACHEALRLKADVVVMDISMPEVDGIEATRRLKNVCPDMKILMLSMHEDVAYLLESMKVGGSGYVLKLAAIGELLHAIETVAEGGTYLDPRLSSKVLAKSMHHEPVDTWTAELSARESEVVRLVALGHTNKEIADGLHLGIKSVETYKARAMTKLGLRGRADFVRYALEKDWMKTS